MPQPDDAVAVIRLALPGPELDLTVNPDSVLLTPHAVQRYRERVEGVSARLAVRKLRVLVSTARWQSRPTDWPPVVLRPGAIYGSSEICPDACLLLRHKVLVTVLVRGRSQATVTATGLREWRHGRAVVTSGPGRRSRAAPGRDRGCER